MESGVCSGEVERWSGGEVRVESGEWRVESGEWRVERGEWSVASRVRSVMWSGVWRRECAV